MNKAKNSNITLVIILHVQVDIYKSIRDTARYLVYISPSEQDLITGVKIDKQRANTYLAKLAQLRPAQRSIIYDKLNKKFYFATGQMKDFDDKSLPEIKPNL